MQIYVICQRILAVLDEGLTDGINPEIFELSNIQSKRRIAAVYSFVLMQEKLLSVSPFAEYLALSCFFPGELYWCFPSIVNGIDFGTRENQGFDNVNMGHPSGVM
jgi:hypothetical protein